MLDAPNLASSWARGKLSLIMFKMEVISIETKSSFEWKRIGVLEQMEVLTFQKRVLERRRRLFTAREK